MCVSTQLRNTSASTLSCAEMSKPQHERSDSSSPSPSSHQVHTVQHDYHDYATLPAPTSSYDHTLNGNRNHNAFPYRLYEMLQLVERDGLDHIVSWQPHGRCFVVHKPVEFTAILPRYFQLTKIASFQRQLNLYNFQRLTKGADRGGYYNEFFLRGKEFLLSNIQRIKVKGTGVRAKSNPQNEPDLYSLVWLRSGQEHAQTAVSVNLGSNVIVSDDDDEQSTAESESIASYESQDAKICAWGMSFYYMPSTEEEAPEVLWMQSETVPDSLTSSDLDAW